MAELAARHGLSDAAVGQLWRLLEALAVEPDPPTTVRSLEAALDVHVADSLSGLEVPELADARTVCDVGAGAGFPGLVLAVALPGARVDLVESTARKTEVIDRLAARAGADNARAVPERAEAWAAGPGRAAYDVVTARAVDRLGVLVEYAAPLLREGGVLVAWKGKRDPAEEEGGAGAGDRLGMTPRAPLRVTPFARAEERHLHVYVKTGPTPAGVPRRPGMARKRPLA